MRPSLPLLRQVLPRLRAAELTRCAEHGRSDRRPRQGAWPSPWDGTLSKRAQAKHRERLEEAQIRYSWIVRQSRMAQRLRVIATQSLRTGKFKDAITALRAESKINDEIYAALQAPPPPKRLGRPPKVTTPDRPQPPSAPLDLSHLSDAELKRIIAGGAAPGRRPPGRPPGYPASGAAKAAHERRLRLLKRQTEERP